MAKSRTSFLGELQKRGIEQLLECELDALLDYEKHQKSKGSNYRNGHTTKRIKSSFGETEINLPRDRDSSFNPMLVKKQQNTIDGIENVIISLYAKGMNVSDIEEQIREIYTTSNKKMAKITLENFKQKWNSKYSYAIKSWGIMDKN